MDEVRDSQGNLVAEYYYDPFGRRLWKTLYPGAEGHPGGAEPVREYLVYSDEGYAAVAGQVRFSTEDEVQASVFYLFAPESEWSTSPVLRRMHTGTEYIQSDELGTAVEKPAQRLRVVSFGPSSTELASNLGFPGQWYDPVLRAYYNKRRDYDPKSGRYLEVDPIGLEGGINLFEYALSNPVNYTDPMGENPLARLLLTFCTRFPAVCSPTIWCMKNPQKCKKRMCGASDLLYKASCQVDGCQAGSNGNPFGESCITLFFRTYARCQCYMNRMLHTLVCVPPEKRNQGHADRTALDQKACFKCLDVFDRRCGDCVR
jgi:RHS repeat-associated protein